MCYHKSLAVAAPELEARYEAVLPPSAHVEPVYHANAYTLPTWPVVTRAEPGKLQLLHWGLVPHWVKTPADADQLRTRTINARAETIFDKPSFRTAAQRGQRCLIPVTGFFEWYTAKSKKYPFYISTTDQKITSVAGLYDEWADPDTGELLRTYTLLTTDANPLLAAIHNSKKRMPCLLTPDAEHAWLHGKLTPQQTLDLLADAYPASQMHSYSIGRRITSRSESTDVPAVLEPVNYPDLADHRELFQ